METVTSSALVTARKADICQVFHPFTNSTRSSSEVFQSQAEEGRYFMEGKRRGLRTPKQETGELVSVE